MGKKSISRRNVHNIKEIRQKLSMRRKVKRIIMKNFNYEFTSSRSVKKNTQFKTKAKMVLKKYLCIESVNSIESNSLLLLLQFKITII